MTSHDWFARQLGLYLSEDRVPASVCAAIRESSDSVASLESTVYRSGRSHPEVLTSARSSRRFYPSQHLCEAVESVIEHQLPRISDHFEVQLGEVEELQFLHYRVGDFFRRHQDARSEPDGSLPAGRRISLVVSLSPAAAHAGGEFMVFPSLGLGDNAGFELGLEEGRLLAFPGDLPHEVRPVTTGSRFSVVTWAK